MARPAGIPGATCSAAVLYPFVLRLRELRVDPAPLLSEIGLPPDAPFDRKARIPHADLATFVTRAVEVSGRPSLGLEAAACPSPTEFDLIGYAAANCATLGEGIALCARALPLAHDGVRLEVVTRGELTELQLRHEPGIARIPAASEFLAAQLVLYGGRYVGRTLKPNWASFAHTEPACDLTHYRSVFREVRWGQQETALVFPTAGLSLRHATANPHLLTVLKSQLELLLGSRDARASFAERVKSAIEGELASGSGAKVIARRLGVSLRTLHRKLSDEGTSYGALLKDIRMDYAMHALEREGLTIDELSRRLGFSRSNAFFKAFKRWTGSTPGAARRESVPPPVAERESRPNSKQRNASETPRSRG
jgi:AraC-like DNA-binding protein